MHIKIHIALIPILLSLLVNCKREKTPSSSFEDQKAVTDSVPPYIVGDSRAMLTAVEHAHGGWRDLLHKQDVEYHYEYRISNGKADISTERYIFETEASFGHYTQHDINAHPEAKGNVTQFFNGQQTRAMVDNKEIKNVNILAKTTFLRRANYFWFVMPYKLNDKGVLTKYLGQEDHEGVSYHKIEITYDASITGKALNDHYILYINPKTKMIDRFYFSLPAFGISTPTILAAYTYTNIDGQLLATKRNYYFADSKGRYNELPDIIQTLSRIKFNNGFTSENIQKQDG